MINISINKIERRMSNLRVYPSQFVFLRSFVVRYSSFLVWRVRHSLLCTFVISGIRHSPFVTRHSSDRGLSLVVVIMAVGALIGGIAASILLMNVAVYRHAQGILGSVQSLADQTGRIGMGAAILADRLQETNLPPVTSEGLGNLVPGIQIEDEGGKLSAPMTLYPLPVVMDQYGLNQIVDRVKLLADVLGLPVQRGAEMTYPLLLPSDRVKAIYGLESPDDLGMLWGLTREEAHGARRWFTPCPIMGVNVNTADPPVVRGVVLWQRRASPTFMEPNRRQVPTDPNVNHDIGQTGVEVMALPTPEPVMVAAGPNGSASYPEEALAFTLPTDELMAEDPQAPYNKIVDNVNRRLWQLVQCGVQASYQPGWLRPVNPPFNSAMFIRNFQPFPVNFSPTYYFNPYNFHSNAWIKFQSVQDPASIASGRPYAIQDLTQPLGAAWITPESWFAPLLPTVIGQFQYIVPWASTVAAKGLNVALSAAAFTGWLSLQGPGPFRCASEWFTFSSSTSAGGGGVTIRFILRVYPDQVPSVVAGEILEE